MPGVGVTVGDGILYVEGSKVHGGGVMEEVNGDHGMDIGKVEGLVGVTMLDGEEGSRMGCQEPGAATSLKAWEGSGLPNSWDLKSRSLLDVIILDDKDEGVKG